MKSILVEKGLLHNDPKPIFITDQKGHLSLAKACLSAEFQTTDVRTRFQDMFWMAVTAQTALRRGSLLPDLSTQNDRAIKYGTITLLMSPPHSKTAEGKAAVFTLVQTPELYRCPIFLFLLLAHLDQALPAEPEHIMAVAAQDPTDEERGFSVLPTWLNSPILRSPRSVGPDTPMIAATLSVDLRRLSRIAGFESNITAHSFRRMVAIFMRVHGKPYFNLEPPGTHADMAGKQYEEIQLKLAHRLEGTVTRSYMNLIWLVMSLKHCLRAVLTCSVLPIYRPLFGEDITEL
jgi:hypothetical protein